MRFENEWYTVPELAEMFKLSRPTITAMFAKEKDVLVVSAERSGRRRKRVVRRYTTLRIPGFVVTRVINQMSNPATLPGLVPTPHRQTREKLSPEAHREYLLGVMARLQSEVAELERRRLANMEAEIAEHRRHKATQP